MRNCSVVAILALAFALGFGSFGIGSFRVGAVAPALAEPPDPCFF
jgi:hypothetical protein